MGAAQIYLLRHGETEWNALGRFQGHFDSPLTAKGRAQALAAGRRLNDLAPQADTIVSSPLGRARQTVEIISSLNEYPTAHWDDRLAEVSIGSWDGLTHIDIEACWPGKLDGSSPFDWFFKSPDGEPYACVVARARDWLSALEGVVVAVSHGLFSRIIRGVYLDLPAEKALELPVGQDVIWVLSGGEVTPVSTK